MIWRGLPRLERGSCSLRELVWRCLLGYEPRTSTPWRSESDKNILVTVDSLLEVGVGQHLDAALCGLCLFWLDAGLLRNECLQTLEISAAVVVDWFRTLAIEPLESRESLDAKAATKLLVLVRIDLGDYQLVFLRLECTGQFIVNGGQSLAVTAPWSEELDESGLARLEDNVVKVGREEVKNG